MKDLREWIELLEAEEELIRVTAEVDPAGELSAVCRRVLNSQGPALLFENIVGFQDSWCQKLFHGGLASSKRLALMFGLPKDSRRRQMTEYVKDVFQKRIEPNMVSTGPVKENVIKKDIDIRKIPVPQWHYWDGGRYINTWASIVTRDPEQGTINVGMYRGMIAGPDKISSLLLASQHWGVHFFKYREMGKPMPVAVVYGFAPSLGFCAGNMLPKDVDEYQVAGAISGAPLDLTLCETNDLPVPASAEFVLEGYIDPHPSTWEMEGPFGEFSGYVAAGRKKRPTIQIECITYRDDPIYQGTLEGARPGQPNEVAFIYSVSSKAIMLQVLEDAGIPGIIDVCPGSINMVKIKQIYQGQARQIAAALWGSDASEFMWKNIMVVNEDINIYNSSSINWAFAHRVNPSKDLIVFPGTPGGVIDPSLSEIDRDEVKLGTGKWNRLLIDATWDLSLRDQWLGEDFPPSSLYIEPEVAQRVEKRWGEYGIDLPGEKRP